MTCLDNVESGALTEFGELQQRVDQGKWITSTSIRAELLTAKIRRGGGSQRAADSADRARGSGSQIHRIIGRWNPS